MAITDKDNFESDALYRQLWDTQENPEKEFHEDESGMWNSAFEAKLKRQNFFSFGFSHYNIFTLSSVLFTGIAVFCLLGLGAYYAFTSFNRESGSSVSEERKVEQENNSLILQDSTAIIAEKDVVITGEKTEKNKLEKTSVIVKDQKNIVNKEKDVVDLVVIDTLKKNKLGINDSSSVQHPKSIKKALEPEVKIVYVEKRDTIEVIDTVRSKKEWRKLNKGK